MKMVIAVEKKKHPSRRTDYKVWYLEIDRYGTVVAIGVKTRQELIQDLFTNVQQTGKTNWRAFLKDHDYSKPIEVFDFISQGMFENTHFGNLPTLCEFQQTLNHLQMRMEFKSIA